MKADTDQKIKTSDENQQKRGKKGGIPKYKEFKLLHLGYV